MNCMQIGVGEVPVYTSFPCVGPSVCCRGPSGCAFQPSGRNRSDESGFGHLDLGVIASRSERCSISLSCHHWGTWRLILSTVIDSVKKFVTESICKVP